MDAGSMVIARQNRYLRAFRAAGADSADAAKTLAEVGCRGSLISRQLMRRGVLVEASQGRFYLDSEAAEAFVARRRKIMLTVLAVVLLGAAVMVWWPMGG